MRYENIRLKIIMDIFCTLYLAGQLRFAITSLCIVMFKCSVCFLFTNSFLCNFVLLFSLHLFCMYIIRYVYAGDVYGYTIEKDLSKVGKSAIDRLFLNGL